MAKLHALHPDAQWVAVFLAGPRQNLEEVLLLQQLEKCCTPLIIGMDQTHRRENCDVELYTATDRRHCPEHMRKKARWVHVRAPDGSPLNGTPLRMAQAREAIARTEFDIPDEDEGQEYAT